VYTSDSEYYGEVQDLTTNYDNYSRQWTANPSTGSAWTWSEIASLQAGISLSGQNANFPAYCTQVWVEVHYAP
jgi:hypothetical protein